MIRIDRGSEPESLGRLRLSELARVRQIPDPSSDDVGRRYRDYAKELRAAQHLKCCYCEIHVHQSFNDVEHYRPKARADRRPGSSATHGYWWLAWTWENLLFACPGCNRSGKNDRFPLVTGSGTLYPEEKPPGPEHPLLIDPAEENGIEHIQFRPDLPGIVGWVPSPREEDARGDETIRVLELGRDDLLDFYRLHVDQRLMPIVHDLQRAIEAGNTNAVQDEWRRALRELRPHNELIGLTYDVLDYFFPPDIRTAWGLELSMSTSR